MGSETQLPTIRSDRNSTATAEGTMQAIGQDTYGSADVLRLARIARPEVGDSEVLIRVHVRVHAYVYAYVSVIGTS